MNKIVRREFEFLKLFWNGHVSKTEKDYSIKLPSTSKTSSKLKAFTEKMVLVHFGDF